MAGGVGTTANSCEISRALKSAGRLPGTHSSLGVVLSKTW